MAETDAHPLQYLLVSFGRRIGNRRAARTPHGLPQNRVALLLRAVSQREALTPLALTVLAAVSYVPALYGGFVWDDAIFAEEPVIHAASGLRSIWFSPADIKNEGHYWPLVYSSFWLELDPHDTEVIDRLAALRFARRRRPIGPATTRDSSRRR